MNRADIFNELHEEYMNMCDRQEGCSECKYNTSDYSCRLYFGYDKGKADAIDEIFCLAKENAYDDGVDYSISLQVLDKINRTVKGAERTTPRNNSYDGWCGY